ncbi:MAG: 2-dehydropantoate 2-reductase [Rhodobacteraceae bacterium]|nr:2-dehydropantoate 2-reductase [Paracoccaceae bacterium]
MRIATLGTGGIGGYLAVRLALAGHEVVTVARGAHLEAIRKGGLVLVAPDGRPETAHPALATDDTAGVGPVDAVIFGVKGDGLPAAARAALPMLGPETVVVPFLNGVEAAARLAEILPPQTVANGVAQVSTTISAPGEIRQTGAFNRFIFAERDSAPSARIDALRAAIAGAGAEAPGTDDIERDLWMKFVLFSALSGVTAAGRCTVGDIRASAQLSDLFHAVAAETAALGRARGVRLPDDTEALVAATLDGAPAALRASTAIDLEHGRPLEIEWVSGAVVRLAAETGLPVPMNAAIYGLLKPHHNGRG